MRVIQSVLLFVLLFVAGSAASSQATGELTIAAGAGYKRLVNQLSAGYTRKTGTEVQLVFGNMGQIIAQSRQSDEIDILIGDKRFLDGTELVFSGEYAIGQGKLMAATAKGVTMDSLDRLTDESIARIALPDAKKAVYGYAAAEFLDNKKLRSQLDRKLLVVGTVPQVAAYVVSGEVDLGFLNLTEALAIKDKVGQLIAVDEALYSPIWIVAKQLSGRDSGHVVPSFVSYLQSDEARAIIKKHGL